MFKQLVNQDLDNFLNNKKRLYEDELNKEDFMLIEKLMHHVKKIKKEKECDISALCYQDCEEGNILNRNNFYSLPVEENHCKLEAVDFEAMNYHSEYVTSPDRNNLMAQQNFFSESPFDNDFVRNEQVFFPDNKKEEETQNQMKMDSPPKSQPKLSQKLSCEPSFSRLNSKEEVSTTRKASSESSECSNSSLPKSSKSVAKPRQMLSLRTDVMNKNLFRAIRRECKCMFEKYLTSHDLTLSKKQKHFVPNLEQFSEHLLSVTNVDWENIDDFNTKDFATYLGIFSNYCAMKKIIKNGRSKEKLEKVYSVLYAYSHVKFNEFMSVPEIRTLIKIICEVSGRESLISGNSTLLANRDSYESHINKLLRSFN